MKSLLIKFIAIIGVMFITVSCGEDWLEPNPKSFYTPENTLVDAEGMEGMLLACRKRLRWITHEWRWLQRIEYIATDISTTGRTPAPKNFATEWLPEGGAFLQHRVWDAAWENIRDANVIISRLPDANIQDQNTRNAILAEAYWHRAFWYFYLTMKFGDVPWAGKEYKSPKLDFYSYTRESILGKIKNDLEYAVQWLPQSVMPGKVNRAAGYYLLTKVYMTVGEFDNAINAASQVIDNGNYHLMTESFGQGAHHNVIWDLFEKKNYSASSNKEAILVTQDKYGLEGNDATDRIRFWAPLWWWTPVRDPDGFGATVYTDDAFSDTVGRGIGSRTPSNYYAYQLSKLPGDLRFSDDNWFTKDEFIYNVPESNYYGQPIQAEYIGIDSIRCLYPWRYDKFYVEDEGREITRNGGHTDWYLYRLAGLYLLRAEAYWYNGNSAAAADDINKIRERANAPLIDPADVDIGTIFDERARELVGEEKRMTEMQRASYILAKQNMMGYSMENFYQKNWWYDRVNEKNNYFRDKVEYGGSAYNIATNNVDLPIPQSAIDANTEGHINQPPGYPGAEDNVEPKTEITPNEAEQELRDDL